MEDPVCSRQDGCTPHHAPRRERQAEAARLRHARSRQCTNEPQPAFRATGGDRTVGINGIFQVMIRNLPRETGAAHGDCRHSGDQRVDCRSGGIGNDRPGIPQCLGEWSGRIINLNREFFQSIMHPGDLMAARQRMKSSDDGTVGQYDATCAGVEQPVIDVLTPQRRISRYLSNDDNVPPRSSIGQDFGHSESLCQRTQRPSQNCARARPC